VPYPVAFRVTGFELSQLRAIAGRVQTVMRSNPHMRQVNQDWGERVPTIHFALDQDRLRLIGLSPNDAAQELQFLLTGIAITQVREDIRTVDVVARTAGAERLDPSRFVAIR
jgi:multidrug efflux pump subunit AcrB